MNGKLKLAGRRLRVVEIRRLAVRLIAAVGAGVQSGLRFGHLPFLAMLGWLATRSATGRPFRVDLVPNGHVYSCNTCHRVAGGPRNLFGEAVEEVAIGSNPFWSAALAVLDSDGDGFSNGLELGDPDGDGVVDLLLPISNPGDPNSVPLTPPEIEVLEPRPGARFAEGEAVVAAMNAIDSQGIRWVEFRWRDVETQEVVPLTDDQAPFRSIWKLTSGDWELVVRAVDTLGAVRESPVRTIRVAPRTPVKLAMPYLDSHSPLALRVTWTGGVGPFQVECHEVGLWDEPWLPLVVTPGRAYTDPEVSNGRLFRVVDRGAVLIPAGAIF